MAIVELTAEAREDFADLDKSAQVKVAKKLRQLETEPGKRGKPLSGDLQWLRSVRADNGNYRIVFRVHADVAVVVWVIAARDDSKCYELARSRLEMHSDREMADVVTELLDRYWARR